MRHETGLLICGKLHTFFCFFCFPAGITEGFPLKPFRRFQFSDVPIPAGRLWLRCFSGTVLLLPCGNEPFIYQQGYHGCCAGHRSSQGGISSIGVSGGAGYQVTALVRERERAFPAFRTVVLMHQKPKGFPAAAQEEGISLGI